MKTALIVTSVASMIQQFNIPNIDLLRQKGYHVSVATNFDKPGTIPLDESLNLRTTLEVNNIKTYNLEFNRSPLSKTNRTAFLKLKKLINLEKFDLIHCQSPVGGTLTRLAAIKARKNGTKVIYTAHGFHFYEKGPIKNWMIYYPIERLLSKYTDVLITINKEDYKRAQTFKAKRVESVSGVGIDLNKIRVDVKKINQIKSEFNINKGDFILLSIGELNHNKNHNVVLDALHKINNKNIKYLIAGNGELLDELTHKAKKMNLQDQVQFLGFRDDIYELLEMADVFIFPSFREGLSKSLMEAMAMGKLIIASDIRGNRDLIDENKGGYLFSPENSIGLSRKIIKAVKNDSFKDKAAMYNREKVKQFSLENVLNQMSEIY